MNQDDWKRDWDKIVENLSKPAKKAKVKELEKEINFLSIAFLGSNNPKKDHPIIYAKLQKEKTKLKRLKLELKITTKRRVNKSSRNIEDIYKIDDDNKIIQITVLFDYNPKKNPVVITSIKKYFLETIVGEIRSEMNYNRPILYILNYSFMKKPVHIKYGGKKRFLTNRATGIIIKYEFLGLSEDWKKTILGMKKLIRKMRSKKFNYVKTITNVKITIGFELQNR